MKNTADVIVIGGGIIGNAISYYLAKRGVKNILCLEASDHFGNGGSSRNGGGVRQSGRDPRELPLVMYGISISGQVCQRSWRLTANIIRMETFVWERQRSIRRSSLL